MSDNPILAVIASLRVDLLARMDRLDNSISSIRNDIRVDISRAGVEAGKRPIGPVT